MLSIAAASHPVSHVTLYAGSAVAECTRVVPLSLPVRPVPVLLPVPPLAGVRLTCRT